MIRTVRARQKQRSHTEKKSSIIEMCVKLDPPALLLHLLHGYGVYVQEEQPIQNIMYNNYLLAFQFG